MRRFRIDVHNIPHREYMNLFGRLIQSTYAGSVLACLGWITFWLDHIPDHVFHLHMITQILFLTALVCGGYGMWIIFLTGNRMGTGWDRLWLSLEALYALSAGLLGLLAYQIFPPH